MANKEHVKLLKSGVRGWNEWREADKEAIPDLSGAQLIRADLYGANLLGARLREADLRGASLENAELSEASLSGADLSGAELTGANLYAADLTDADLSKTILAATIFASTDLSTTKGLETCSHEGPSSIDYHTLKQSSALPLKFLRGCGLPDHFIDYLPSLINQPIQYYSCFISYSSKDKEFTQRLHADLQDNGVRCWYAPKDMKIGDKIRVRIDEVIRFHEKLLLVLSERSIDSSWVEKEVETAFEKEEENKETVLFPIRLDDAIMHCDTGWAADIKRSCHIGDFCEWKDHDSYKESLEKLLRDLKPDLVAEQ